MASGRNSTPPNARECSLRVSIKIWGLDSRVAEASIKALRVDDRTAPSWLKIEEKYTRGVLEVVLEVDADACERIGSLRNTVNEILEFTYSLLKTIEETAKTLKGASASTSREPG